MLRNDPIGNLDRLQSLAMDVNGSFWDHFHFLFHVILLFWHSSYIQYFSILRGGQSGLFHLHALLLYFWIFCIPQLL